MAKTMSPMSKVRRSLDRFRKWIWPTLFPRSKMASTGRNLWTIWLEKRGPRPMLSKMGLTPIRRWYLQDQLWICRWTQKTSRKWWCSSQICSINSWWTLCSSNLATWVPWTTRIKTNCKISSNLKKYLLKLSNSRSKLSIWLRNYRRNVIRSPTMWKLSELRWSPKQSFSHWLALRLHNCWPKSIRMQQTPSLSRTNRRSWKKRKLVPRRLLTLMLSLLKMPKMMSKPKN